MSITRLVRHHVILLHQWETSRSGSALSPGLKGAAALRASTLLTAPATARALISVGKERFPVFHPGDGVFTRFHSLLLLSVKLFQNPLAKNKVAIATGTLCQGLQGFQL